MTTVALSILILVLSVSQKERANLFSAYVYGIIHIAHLAVSPLMDGWIYYISAAAADILIMSMMLRSKIITSITVSLMRVCIAEILINMIGWIMWFNYMEPTLYDNLFYVLNLWVILILIRKDQSNELGGRKSCGNVNWLRLVIGKSCHTI